MQALTFRKTLIAGVSVPIAYRAEHIYHISGPSVKIGVDTPSIELSAGKGIENIEKPTSLIVESAVNGDIELLCCVGCTYKDDRLAVSSTISTTDEETTTATTTNPTINTGALQVVSAANASRKKYIIEADEANTGKVFLFGDTAEGQTLTAGARAYLNSFKGVIEATADTAGQKLRTLEFS